MQVLDKIFIFIFGLCWGSFLNVCIYRIPRNKSIINPPSHCPVCQQAIKPIDNIPLVSYLLLRGRCRYCQTRIPLRYPTVEALTAIIFLLFANKYGWGWERVICLALASVLVVIAFIDLEHYLIPDVLTYPTIIIGLVLSLLPGGVNPLEAIIGLLVGGGVIYLLLVVSPYVFGKEGMGGGDVKLAALMGVYLGWQKVLLGLFFASLSGSIVGGILILLGKKGRRDYIPFGPYLVLGTLIMLLWKENLMGLLRWLR
ncbi:TPA: prepilin peptidase [bacterium]|nr:prepilin peptidase [bacterium]